MTRTSNGVTYDDDGKVLSVNMEFGNDLANPPTPEAWAEWWRGLAAVMGEADNSPSDNEEST